RGGRLCGLPPPRRPDFGLPRCAGGTVRAEARSEQRNSGVDAVMVVAANVTSLHDARPEVDPAHDMDMTIGDISELEIAGSQVLVGVYLRGERTAGGIIDPTQIAEDKIQGKCVRVLKLGNTAFTGDNPGWNGNPPKVGDWVFHRAQ